MTLDQQPFSVLMPFYSGDRPEHVAAAFRSVTVDQTLPPAEVVLVQDGPVAAELTSTVRDLVRTCSVPVQWIELPTNQGLAAALTQGLARVSHDIVARMDADDLSLPQRFEAQVPLIVGGLDVVGSALTEFGEDGTPGRFRPVPVGADEIGVQARLRSPFHHPSVVYRASAVARVGGYEDVRLLEDYWLWARLLMAGAAVGNVADSLLLYRVSDGAYARRGGWDLLRSEWELQRAFAQIGFTTSMQRIRNIAMRGGYRLVPEFLRKVAYRAVFARGKRHTQA